MGAWYPWETGAAADDDGAACGSGGGRGGRGTAAADLGGVPGTYSGASLALTWDRRDGDKAVGGDGGRDDGSTTVAGARGGAGATDAAAAAELPPPPETAGSCGSYGKNMGVMNMDSP